MSGVLVVFRNRRAKALKLIVYDGQGYWLAQKRLSSGRFGWWPTTQSAPSLKLTPHQLHLLLWNGDPSHARVAPMWRAIRPES